MVPRRHRTVGTAQRYKPPPRRRRGRGTRQGQRQPPPPRPDRPPGSAHLRPHRRAARRRPPAGEGRQTPIRPAAQEEAPEPQRATAVDLITQPDVLKDVRAEFDERTKTRKWSTMLPDGT